MKTFLVIQTMLQEAYRGPARQGPHPRGVLRVISANSAMSRPGHSRHSIAEIALPCAYWYAAFRRMTGGKRGIFPIKGSHWFSVHHMMDAEWKDQLQLLLYGMALHDVYHAGQIRLLEKQDLLPRRSSS